MGKKIKYSSTLKYHRTSDGRVLPCSANVRGCKYGGEHFDSVEEAQSFRQRRATRATLDDVVTFNTLLDPKGASSPTLKQPTDRVASLREASTKARDAFYRTGRKPLSPLGTVGIPIPGGQRIEVTRESYDDDRFQSGIGARYMVRYFSNNDEFEQSVVELNNKLDYQLLTTKIDEYYAEAAEQNASRGVEADLIPSYDKTLQAISDIEVMARGSESTYKDLGVDIFSHEKPTVMDLNIDYSNSTLNTYDVADALRGHAMVDKKMREVSVRVSDQIPSNSELDNSGSRWHLTRLPEGHWYVGANTAKGVISQEVKEPVEAARLIGIILKSHKVPEEEQVEPKRYVQQLMTEVEPAVKNYEHTMRAKLNSQEVEPRPRLEGSVKLTPPLSSKSFGERLNGLLGR